MPVLRKWNNRDSLFGIWKVEESAMELRSLLSDSSCDDEVWSGYRSMSRQKEYLAARVLLKELCGAEHNIMHNQSGKPYLADKSYHISISHTKGYVAVGLNPYKEIGLDIECCSDRVRKIESRFVRSDEVIADNCKTEVSDGDIATHRLLLMWSAKETVFKVLNSVEVDFIKHIRIFPFEITSDTGLMCAEEYKTPFRHHYSIEYIIDKDFVFTCCVVD